MPMNESPSQKAFMASPYYSLKYSNYFAIYDRLLSNYSGKEITFIEIGVLEGGSLFMWREFFGPSARIIGVDLNPSALKWQEEGFEIVIGDQSNFDFWTSLFEKVGNVDVILDDGGHKNTQQMTTLLATSNFVKDGGMIIIEDTVTSYIKFGNFRSASFVEFSKKLVDKIHLRKLDTDIKSREVSNQIFEISYFQNIVAFHIDRRKILPSTRVDNNGERNRAIDFRYSQENSIETKLRQLYDLISLDQPGANRIAKLSKFYRLTRKGFLRKILRIIIVPPRFFIYLGIKTLNLFRVRALINHISKRED